MKKNEKKTIIYINNYINNYIMMKMQCVWKNGASTFSDVSRQCVYLQCYIYKQ